MSDTPLVTAEDIVGTWLMVDRGAGADEQEQLRERYGEKSEGLVIISPGGWLCAAVCRAGREPLPGNPAWAPDAPAEARLAAFDSYVSYGGRWRVENGQLITKVAFALNPSWVGGDQVRDLELREGGILRLMPVRTWADGRKSGVWIDWKRAE